MNRAFKIAIIGNGHVGSHCAYALATQSLASEIVMIDVDEKKAWAQAKDVGDATNYLNTTTRLYAGGYEDIDDCDIVVVSAGPLPDLNSGEIDRMLTLGKTLVVVDDIIAKLKKTKFNGIIINISNPADVISYYIYKKLNWDRSKIICSGTVVDSARLRRVLAEKLKVDQHSITAFMMGEHGESQFFATSVANIFGLPVSDLLSKEEMSSVEVDAKAMGWNILIGKGSTEFGIGTSLARIVKSIMYDEHKVLTAGVFINGEYGINDVILSVPATIGRNGVEKVLEVNLDEEDRNKLKASANRIREAIDNNLGV